MTEDVKPVRRGLLPLLVGAGVLLPGCLNLDLGLDVDPGYYPATPPDAGSCPPRWQVVGSLQTGAAEVRYDGGKAVVTAAHKRDVDVDEDGCIGRLEVTLTQSGGACPLTLVFSRFQGGVGGLIEARFTADSACPGFRDEVEGVYTSAPGFAPWRYEGPREVPGDNVAEACLGSVRLGFPARPVRLYRSSPSAAELTVSLQGLMLTGDLGSQGQADAVCFDATSCGAGRHDGGDGWCVDSGQCSSGYRLALDGTCSP